jgi:predicted dehydrogenase
MTLRIGIVGCGAVVERLYRGALRKVERRGIARVTALIDPNAERTAALRRDFRSAAAFATPAEAFAGGAPDLVIVASPPGLHAAHTLEAFAAGGHVLCEKPMTVGVADAERMVEAARAARRVLAVGLTRRVWPALAEARGVLEAGALGEPVQFTYREGFVYGWPVSTDAPFRRASAGGGVLTDLGSHVIDFLIALFGAPEVTGYADDAQSDGVESNCRATLAFPAARGTVQLSWSQPLVSGLRITGPAGELLLDPGHPEAVRVRQHGGAWAVRPNAATWPIDLRADGPRAVPHTRYDFIYHQLVSVLRAVDHGEPVPVSGEQGLHVVRAIDACYRGATPLDLPWLGAAEQATVDARHWSRRPWAA